MRDHTLVECVGSVPRGDRVVVVIERIFLPLAHAWNEKKELSRHSLQGRGSRVATVPVTLRPSISA
jgi:hypothetical protein